MDFIDGPNLRNFTGTLEEPIQQIPLLLTVAETLKHAHARNVVHRDVKPENIILSQDTKGNWRPHLTDFDLAWYSTASRLTKDAFGTVQYSAPEQMATPMAASAHAPITDSYSFGQLCFYAVTGSDPVPLEYANNYRALEVRLRGGWVVSAAHEFMNLYADCTEHKYAKRPTFEAICDRLFRILQLLRDISPTQTLSDDRFIQELIFSMVGLSAENQQGRNTFISLSGKTRVETVIKRIQHKSVDVTFDFYSQYPLTLDGATTHDQARKALFSRVGNVISNFSETRLRHGSVSPFQVFIDYNSVPLSLEGVGNARALISRVIEVVESA
jgi:serine/threonine protein kinase